MRIYLSILPFLTRTAGEGEAKRNHAHIRFSVGVPRPLKGVVVAGTRQTSTTTDQRTRRSVPLTPDRWAALKEIARLEQRSMQSQMSVMLGEAIARYRPSKAKKATR
jgi:hypothetical protein